MLRFFAPQRATAAVFARQYGDPPAPTNPGDPPPPVVTVIPLEAGAPTAALPVLTCEQIKLDAEFAMVDAPAKRTVLLARTGSTL